MPEALLAALAEPGLVWLVLTSFIAGIVYGFAGFGSALIFMPLATIFVAPPLAIAAFSLSALASLATVVPGAWAVADRRQTVLMLAAALIGVPLGVAVLSLAPEATIRTAVCTLTLATLGALVAGWKMPVQGGPGLRLLVGGLSGLSGGATGLNGPPVILFNLGTDQPVAVTRANLACFLTLNSLMLMPMMALQGLIDANAIWLGAILLMPYGLGTWTGTQIFRPGWAGMYRWGAYSLIGAAGIMGLPIWS